MHTCVTSLKSWSCSLHRFVKTKMFRPNTPEEVDAHNLNIQLAKDGMYFDVDSYSDDEFEGEQDDLDFYKIQQKELFRGRSNTDSISLPCDGMNLSEEKMRTSRLPPMTTVTRTVMLTNLTVRK